MLRKVLISSLLISVGKALGTLLTFAVAYFLTVADYGAFQYARNLIFLFSVLSLLGLQVSLVANFTHIRINGTSHALQNFMQECFTTVLMSSLVICLIFIAIWAFVPLEPLLGWMFVLAAPSVVLAALMKVLGQFCIGVGAPNAAFVPVYFVISATTTLLIAGMTLISGGLDATGAVLALLGGHAAAFYAQFLFFHHVRPPDVGRRLLTRRPSFRIMLRSAPLVVTTVSNLVILRFSLLVMPAFLTLDDVGRFGFAIALVMINRVVIEAAVGSYLAKVTTAIAHADYRRASRLLRQFRGLMLLMNAGLSALVIAVGPVVFDFLFDEAALSRSVLAILTVGVAAFGLAGPLDRVAIALGRQRSLITIDAASALVSVAAALVLIAEFGLVGAALANSAGLIVQQIGRIVLVHRVAGLAL